VGVDFALAMVREMVRAMVLLYVLVQ